MSLNNQHITSKKFILVNGLIGFLFLTVLSLIFYRERMIFSDASFYLFKLVAENNYAIFHFRFIAILTETLPLIARKQELSINTIVQLYSISFPLIGLILFLSNYYFDKEGNYLLVAALTPFLFITSTFYWTCSEMTQGIMFCCLFFTIHHKLKAGVGWHWLFLPFILFSHLWAVITFFYWIAFFFLHQPNTRRNGILLSTISIAILLLKTLFFQDIYDHSALGGLRNIRSLFPHYFSCYSFKHFALALFTQYYWIGILLLLISIHYLKEKKYLKLLLTLAATLGCIFLVNVCFPEKITPIYYWENLFQPIAVFLLLPFVFDILPSWKPKLSKIIIASIIITCMIRIGIAAPVYSQRLSYIERMYHDCKSQKTIIPENSLIKRNLNDTWATPYECWLIAAMNNDPTPSIIVTQNVSYMQKEGSHPKTFLVTWNPTLYIDYPKKYFRFVDSNSFYQVKDWQ